MKQTIQFTLNGEPVTLETEADRKLLWVLRTDLEKTGTKYGCGAGMCGSCTVIVDGAPVRSCIVNVDYVQGKSVTTIEGLGDESQLHPLQEAFWETHGLQCGFCTPGFLMSLQPFLHENPNPSDDEIRHALSGNLCRCTGYQNIVEAVRLAAGRMAE